MTRAVEEAIEQDEVLRRALRRRIAHRRAIETDALHGIGERLGVREPCEAEHPNQDGRDRFLVREQIKATHGRSVDEAAILPDRDARPAPAVHHATTTRVSRRSAGDTAR